MVGLDVHLDHGPPYRQGGDLVVVGLDAPEQIVIPQKSGELTGQAGLVVGEETVNAISRKTEVPAPIVTEVIPRLQLNLVPAAQAKDQLVDFYTRLSTINPDIVGGKMPADDFYLKDPR